MTMASFPVLGLTVLAALGGLSLWWLVETTTHNRLLRRMVLISYCLRMFLGIGLYLISDWSWPILRDLQLSDGFWIFGLDSHVYHSYSAKFVEA